MLSTLCISATALLSRSAILLPLRLAATPRAADALVGRSLLITEPSNKGSADSSSAMLTGTTLAGLMAGASFGPPKSLLRPLGREWPQKLAAQADTQAPISYTSLTVHYLSKFPHLQQIHYILLQPRKLHFLRPLSGGTSFTSDNTQPAQSFVPTISCDEFATTILRSPPAMDPRHIRCKDLKRNILDAFERLRNSETSINPKKGSCGLDGLPPT
jgi:hypothetical protein